MPFWCSQMGSVFRAMNSSTGKPRIIACAEDLERYVAVPRGCLEEVQALLADLHIEMDVRDQWFAGNPLQVTFHGQLRPEQLAAARRLIAHDTGVLSATTAFGKTVIAAWLIAERAVNTLVLVHRRQLVDQWIDGYRHFWVCPRGRSDKSAEGRDARRASWTLR